MKDLSSESLVRAVGRCLPAVTFAVGLIACTAGREKPAPSPAAPHIPAPPLVAVTGASPVPGALRAPVPPVVRTATCGAAVDARAALAHVNRLRAAGADCRGGGRFGPTPALAWNAALLQAAAAHSRDMAAHDQLSHTGSDGSTMSARAAAAGYGWLRIGENIAAGPLGAEAAIDMWIGSDGHCANLMNPEFRDVALACAPGGTGSPYRTYWTLELGRSR